MSSSYNTEYLCYIADVCPFVRVFVPCCPYFSLLWPAFPCFKCIFLNFREFQTCPDLSAAHFSPAAPETLADFLSQNVANFCECRMCDLTQV